MCVPHAANFDDNAAPTGLITASVHFAALALPLIHRWGFASSCSAYIGTVDIIIGRAEVSVG